MPACSRTRAPHYRPGDFERRRAGSFLGPGADQVTRAIHDQVGRILNTTNFYIALYDEEHREWELVLDIVDGQPQPPSRTMWSMA